MDRNLWICEGCSYFKYWVELIEKQFGHSLFLEYERGYEFMSGMMILVIIALKNMKIGQHKKFGEFPMNK